jgi:hypothetical protein
MLTDNRILAIKVRFNERINESLPASLNGTLISGMGAGFLFSIVPAFFTLFQNVTAQYVFMAGKRRDRTDASKESTIRDRLPALELPVQLGLASGDAKTLARTIRAAGWRGTGRDRMRTVKTASQRQETCCQGSKGKEPVLSGERHGACLHSKLTELYAGT